MRKRYSNFIQPICLILLVVAIFAIPASAEEWLFMETDNFQIIYHPEIKDQALQVAEIAEEVYPGLRKYTGFTPYRKIAIIVSGYEDIANGWAQPRDIAKVWVNPLYIPTRVDREWLKNVVTHELTHVLQMETTFGATYTTHKLTGASSILALPPNTYYPGWYLEGLAQYGATRQGYDGLDRKRLMVMEQKIHDKDFYTDAELYWNRSPLGGEAFYNYGFGFVEFLMRTYGEEKLVEVQKTHNSFYLLGHENTMRMVYGKSLEQLVEEWKADLKERFPIRKDRLIAKELTIKPELSEWAQPQLVGTNSLLYVEKNINRIAQKVQLWTPDQGIQTLLEDPYLQFTRISFAPDLNELLYTRIGWKGKHIISDLYRFDLRTGKTEAITDNERILMAAHYKDGYLMVKNNWGKTHLYTLQGGKFTQLTNTDYNFNITDLKVSPDQTKVAINFNYNGRRGIGILNTDSWQYEKIFSSPEGEDWILGDFIDDQHLTFSWDRLEHYDLYQLNLVTGQTQRITNTQEDVLYGWVTDSTWYGQIYGAEGFTLASGPLYTGKTFTVTETDLVFTTTPPTKIRPIKQGGYNHFAQLRKDIMLPYVQEAMFGITQLWIDPLMELQILSDFQMSMDQDRLNPKVSVQAIWLGSQPNLSLMLNADETQIGMELAQAFNLHPFYLSLTESLHYSDQPVLDAIQVQLAKVWESKYPAQTILLTSYYPAQGAEPAGYLVQGQHYQTRSIGYNGDSLSSTTTIVTTGGNHQIQWGKDTSLFWADSEARLAQTMVMQKLDYQHNLIDLSTNVADLVQTGRLYLNISGQAAVVSDGHKLMPADQLGAGLLLEAKIAHLIPSNISVDGAINSKGDWKIKYNVASPF